VRLFYWSSKVVPNRLVWDLHHQIKSGGSSDFVSNECGGSLDFKKLYDLEWEKVDRWRYEAVSLR